MHLLKLNSIDFRAFNGFKWQAELPDFASYNLIYGWNGSGKTTFSQIFRNIEKKCISPDCMFELEIDGQRYDHNAFISRLIDLKIKVFNNEFVKDNVFNSQGHLEPIYYIGENSITKQAEVEDLRKVKLEKERELSNFIRQSSESRKRFDRHIVETAKRIKDLLSSSGSNYYNTYHKTNYSDAAMRMKRSQDREQKKLSSDQRNELKKRIEQNPKRVLDVIDYKFANTAVLQKEVSILVDRTVSANTLERLSADPELSEWVKEGLSQHYKKNSQTCLFCEQNLPHNHLSRLAEHFNREYVEFAYELKSYITKLKDLLSLSAINLPSRDSFYDDLAEIFESHVSKFVKEQTEYRRFIQSLIDLLEKKCLNIFISLEFTIENGSSSKVDLDEINKLIQNHNEITKDFQNAISKARKQLEEDIILECQQDFTELEFQIDYVSRQVNILQDEIRELNKNIDEISKAIVQHRTPAEQLNKDLACYLGRSELCITTKENGYTISRNGVPATSLSEGERTAVAFLYFLKTLEDQNFNIRESIVIIDDPVSSLDANSLFHAFGFLKERTKHASQLFVLTHNFTFYQQVKDWFNKMRPDKGRPKDKTKHSYYMLRCYHKDGNRKACLLPLSKLLIDYSSEYHYLFKLLYDYSKQEEIPVEACHTIPNAARRVLEYFLAFKVPNGDNCYNKLFHLNHKLDAARLVTIYRYTNFYSHPTGVGLEGHDISILSETRKVLQDLFELMESADRDHFTTLCEAIQES
ncbi:AAA family ATPase [Desulfocurvibacter africanus]|uniref:AAA family ATPase n=1 Tax=Desulfocurvibacter africanus TaxID=873 RepID=UPI002FDA9C4B